MQYTILMASTLKALIETVNEHIELGWKPQGGVCVTADDYYFQAMIEE